ncbi:hypothetical protein D3C76_1510590 [compost metagenome]
MGPDLGINEPVSNEFWKSFRTFVAAQAEMAFFFRTGVGEKRALILVVGETVKAE